MRLLAVAGLLPASKLGLDLLRRSQLTLQVMPAGGHHPGCGTGAARKRAGLVLDRRVNGLGVAESTLQDRRRTTMLLLQLPREQDPTRGRQGSRQHRSCWNFRGPGGRHRAGDARGCTAPSARAEAVLARPRPRPPGSRPRFPRTGGLHRLPPFQRELGAATDQPRG